MNRATRCRRIRVHVRGADGRCRCDSGASASSIFGTSAGRPTGSRATDIAMPDDGLRLIREVKTVAQTKGIHVPAIAVTAHRGRGTELLAEGFVELVEKPLDSIVICKVIRRHAVTSLSYITKMLSGFLYCKGELQ